MKLTRDIEKESIKRINDRNNRTLLLNMSEDLGITNKEELYKIVSNAVSIRVPNFSSRNKYLKSAFIEFDSPNETEESFSHLQTLTFPIGSLTVSRTGIKGCNVEKDIDPVRLYVSGIPVEAKTEELKKLFPKATVNRNDTSKFRNRADYKTFAVVEFSNEEDATATFWATKDAEILGRKLLVLFAKNDAKKSKLLSNQKGAAKKKIKRLQKASKAKKSLSKSSDSKNYNKGFKDVIKKSIQQGLIKFDEEDT